MVRTKKTVLSVQKAVKTKRTVINMAPTGKKKTNVKHVQVSAATELQNAPITCDSNAYEENAMMDFANISLDDSFPLNVSDEMVTK